MLHVSVHPLYRLTDEKLPGQVSEGMVPIIHGVTNAYLSSFGAGYQRASGYRY